MKKVIRLTESDLIKLIRQVISEEKKTVTTHDSSFDYKKDGQKYYFKGKGKYKEKFPDWTLATDSNAIEAIKTKVFELEVDDDVDDDNIESDKVDTVKKSKEKEKIVTKIEKSTEVQLKKDETPSKKGNPEQVIKFLISKGFSLSQSAGICGNLYHESGLNPTVKPGDGGTSFGIAQWHKERGTKMKKWTKENGYSANTIEGQLEYLVWELKNTEKNSLRQLRDTKNPQDAAFAFAKYYERCSACQNRERIKKRLTTAQKFYDEY